MATLILIGIIIGSILVGVGSLGYLLEFLGKREKDERTSMANEVIKSLKEFKEQMDGVGKNVSDHNSWLKDYHKLFLEKLALDTKSRRVYAFSVKNLNNEVDRLIISPGDSFEQAQNNMLPVLLTDGTKIQDWLVKAHVFLDVPTPEKESSIFANREADKQLGESMEQKPVGIFINYLQYASDKFTDSSSQKKAIEGIIKNIKQYESTIKK